MEFITSDGYSVQIDPEDYDRVVQYKWTTFQPKKSRTRYVCCDTRKTRKKVGVILLLHRFVTQCPAGMVVDHRDQNGLNNQKQNLRICTHAQNVSCSPHREVAKESKYRGVHLCKSTGRWRATIKYQGKQLNLGRFNTDIEAARCYDEKAKELKGEFAYQNFPERKA